MCQSHEKLDTTFDLEFALKYITKAKMIKPDNKAIIVKFNEIKNTLRKQNNKDKKQFKGMFNRGSIYDDKRVIVEKETKDQDNKSVMGRIYRYCLNKYLIMWCVVCLVSGYLFISRLRYLI